MSISENLRSIRSTLLPGVELLAVSKFHPVDALMEAYDCGQRLFGESRVQELATKVPQMPSDVHWHFIGHLQTNKVRQLVKWVDTIQSIDSVRLLQLVDDEAARIGRQISVMLQVHVAQEETKFGFLPQEAVAQITPELVASLKSVRIVGIMGMATNTDDTARIEADFRTLSSVKEQLAATVFADSADFRQLSMGMSDDYVMAMECGSTMVRIGTDIFGLRQY